MTLTAEQESEVIDITDFESLLTVAGQQDEPQRLLFVFLQASLPPDSNVEQIDWFEAGEGGGLDPVMCVDKALDELSGFPELVTESERMGQDWHIVLVASLAGQNGIAPSPGQAEESLKMMVQTVQNGGDLSGFVAFKKNGDPVQFG